MPIYEYFCEECNFTKEIMQKVSDPAPDKCSNCHKEGSLKKIISQSAFHLKGGGWYKDLYSSTKKNNNNKKGSK